MISIGSLGTRGLRTSAVALAFGHLIAAGVAASAPSHAAGPIQVPLTGVFRLCNHDARTFVPAVGNAQALALISTSDTTVTARVTMGYAPADQHYTVRLIQVPRPSSDDCGVNGAGVAAAGLDTDDLGNGTVVVSDAIRPGTTGAWVVDDRPNEFSQTPTEHYTSDFIAAI